MLYTLLATSAIDNAMPTKYFICCQKCHEGKGRPHFKKTESCQRCPHKGCQQCKSYVGGGGHDSTIWEILGSSKGKKK
jgi:hypothetical protein